MLSPAKMKDIEKRLELHNEQVRAQTERYSSKRIIEGGADDFLVQLGVLVKHINSDPDGNPNVSAESVLWSFLESYERWKTMAKKVKATPPNSSSGINMSQKKLKRTITSAKTIVEQHTLAIENSARTIKERPPGRSLFL